MLAPHAATKGTVQKNLTKFAKILKKTIEKFTQNLLKMPKMSLFWKYCEIILRQLKSTFSNCTQAIEYKNEIMTPTL